ncbi:MAG: hypothetical protein J0G30_04325 [Actinomycetales bacterium]|nr:hypothetical protein [Actinomycetales bacterium]
MSVAPDHPSLGRFPRRPALLALHTLPSGDVEVRARGRLLGRIEPDGETYLVRSAGGPLVAGLPAATLTEALDLLSAAPPTELPRR